MDIRIDLLKNHTDSIPQLAKIWQEVLGNIWLPNISIEQVKQKLLTHINDKSLPLTFVAFHNNNPVGMCSLRENDGIRPELKPWLGSLVVDSAYQKLGIAPKLMNSVKQKALELDFETLYLLTFDPTLPDYYDKHGWDTIGTDIFQGHPVTVMEVSQSLL